MFNQKKTGEVTVYPHPDALPQDVLDFLAIGEKTNFGFGFDWYRNLANTVYPDNHDLRFYCLRSQNEVTALIPIRGKRSFFGWNACSLGNFYTTLYAPVLASEVAAAALLPVFEAIRRDFRSLGSLTFVPMDRNCREYAVLIEALALAKWMPFEFFAFGNWFEPVTGTWADYLKKRTANLRSTINRMKKKLAGVDGVLEVVTNPESLPDAIAAYEKVYAASWKKPEPYPNFMPGLLKICAEKGMLRLGLARLNGQAIAAQVWLVANGRAEIYKVAYDEEFKQYSPGTLVTALLMEHVIDKDKVEEVDYLIGDDAYKKVWMSERRERWGIVAYNVRSLHGLGGFTREWAARRIKKLVQVYRQRRQRTALSSV